MSTIGKRVIYVGPADGAESKPLNVEGTALASGILPGTFVSQSTGGLAISTDLAVTDVLFLVADKDEQRSRSVDDPWTENENMVAIQPRSGEFVNALVDTGQVLTIGTPLTKTVTGYLTTALLDGSQIIFAYADELITTSAVELVRVRVK